MILLVDNYDSFVFNLARYFERLGQPTQVVRNDAIDAAGVRAMSPGAIILSPGPCAPEQAGCSLELVRELTGEFPILGVCLGHQTIGQALGGRVVRAARPVHGSASHVVHDGQGVLAGVPSPFLAGRYHSLVVEEASLPDCLAVTARTEDGAVMALEHREHAVVGLQFHPESILTEHGYTILAGFLRRAGLEPGELPSFDSELAPARKPPELPAAPVTF
jgi:anthranilate synthase/aminodeoxychorismate synthase-like glutamine amidotransferase